MQRRLRVATPSDAASIRTIYAPYCESTPISFEETPPTEAELAGRIERTLERYPWLVCELDGAVVGYAYAGPLRTYDAYEWVVELSVYVADRAQGTGVGRALYASLFAILERQGVRDAYAVTAVPNPGTEAFHDSLGFELLATFPAIGYSNGDWRDVRWWRKPLVEKTPDPDPIAPFSALLEAGGDGGIDDLVRVGEAHLEAA